MTRMASVWAIPVGVVLALTTGATGADAGGRHHVRDSCETRIFQRESQACFKIDGRYVLFEKAQDPVPEAAALAGEPQASGFTADGLDCGCQLRRRYDLICARRDTAVIGAVERRGRTIVGEEFEGGGQTKLTARRVALSECGPAEPL